MGVNGNGSLANAKTNPIGNNKAKAFDLNSPTPKQSNQQQPNFVNRVNNFNY